MKTSIKVLLILVTSFLFASNAAIAQWSLTGNSGTSTLNFIGTTDLRPLIFKTNGTEKMRINTNSYVGIGITTPWCKTHINGDLFITGTGKNNVPGTASLFLGDNNVQPQFGIEYENGGLNFWKPFGSTNGNGGNGFGNAFLFIKDNGNVGIGTSLTTNPNNYKLAVNGTIGAKAITIEITSSTWADFVFENNYKLKSLYEVENYIKEYHHLPGISAADEIEKNGLNVEDMLKLQMQKIEELTLYIIEQNKRIETIQSELNGIEDQKKLTNNINHN